MENIDLIKAGYEYDYNEIKYKIVCKTTAFREKYTVNPNFIKMPYWLWYGIKEKAFGNAAAPYEGRFLGLRICPTVSISSIDEIEVF